MEYLPLTRQLGVHISSAHGSRAYLIRSARPTAPLEPVVHKSAVAAGAYSSGPNVLFGSAGSSGANATAPPGSVMSNASMPLMDDNLSHIFSVSVGRRVRYLQRGPHTTQAACNFTCGCRQQGMCARGCTYCCAV